MPGIVWLPTAIKDIQRLRLFLENKSPNSAQRAVVKMLTGAEILTLYPEAGIPLNDGTDRRELVLPFGSGAYVLRYLIENQTVFIVRAWHSKENRR